LSYSRTAFQNATEEEKKYLPIVQRRIEKGSLSEIVRKKVEAKSQKTEFKEAIVDVYLKLAESLIDDQPYF
jgi:hemerythrin-like domain-containing protein